MKFDNAVLETRNGKPNFIEIECYRLNSHSKGDDNRSDSEIDLYYEKDITNLEKCVVLLQMLTFVGDDLYDDYVNFYPGKCNRRDAENFLRANASFIDY